MARIQPGFLDRRTFMKGAAAFAASSLILPGMASAAVAKSVSYGSNTLDIYPSGKDNSPVMIYVHGGAWLAGSKSRVGAQPAFYNGMGYTYVSVGYTLYPSASVERQAREIGQAVAWVRANIGRYGGNPNRVALSGHSAGCHLASLASLSGLATGIKALIANDTAAYDLSYLAEINNGRLPALYARPFSDRSKWTNWSPYNYAGQSARFPVLVCWSGGRDRDRISKRFADRLQAAGYPVSRFNGGAYNHISIQNAMGRRGDRLTSAMATFLNANV